MTEHGSIALNGFQFTLLSAGPKDGEPVILLHGFPQFPDVWTQLLATLGRIGFRAVALDQRGYCPGARPVETESYGVAELSSDVIALANALEWPGFHLIGHDWGGFIAWQLAAHHPDRVRSLSVLSTAHIDAFLNAVASDPDQKARSQYIQLFKMPDHVAEAMFLKDDGARLRGVFQGKVPEEQVSTNVQRLLEPGALTATLNWYRALDLDARIGPVSVPTLYIWEIKTWRSGVQRRKQREDMSTVSIVLRCCRDTRIGYRTKPQKRSETSSFATLPADEIVTTKSARFRTHKSL